MHIAFLVLAWLTPAFIAGVLGWSGIWGSGSAFLDYLIPIPVAGGVLHVPSFVVAAGVIIATRKASPTAMRYVPVLAFAAMAAALSLMLEFDRINDWLFTDYAPHGSPFRLDGNPLLLFVATDAFWVGVYGLVRGCHSPARSWLALPIVPIVAIGFSVVTYQASGPTFEFGGSTYTGVRGEQIVTVYTSAPYDEAAFMRWVEEDRVLHLPWSNVNSEHVAVIFTTSMQMIKWGRFDEIDSDSTVATICLYEEDRAIVPHRGYHDCFAERNTAEEDLALLLAENETGLGRDVDQWYAHVLMCDSVDAPPSASRDIARVGMCQGLSRVYPERANRFVAKYGEGSDQVRFVEAQASARGLTTEGVRD